MLRALIAENKLGELPLPPFEIKLEVLQVPLFVLELLLFVPQLGLDPLPHRFELLTGSLSPLLVCLLTASELLNIVL